MLAGQIKTIAYQYRPFIKTYYYLGEIILLIEISADFGAFNDFLVMFAFDESQECWPDDFITFSEGYATIAPTIVQLSEIVLLSHMLSSKLLKDNQFSMHLK